MSDRIWFSAGGGRVAEAVRDSFGWAERCYIASDAPLTAEDGFWAEVGRNAARVAALFVWDPQSADAEVLVQLGLSEQLLGFSDGVRRGDLLWFEQGEVVRVFIAPDSLNAETLEGPGLWFCCEGRRDELPAGLVSFWDACVAGGERAMAGGTGSSAGQRSIATQVYSRPIPSVREVLNIRSPRSFEDLEDDAQELALWSALIGEGELDMDRAVRVCAERLRAQGFVEYQVLRQEDRLYVGLEERLKAARRKGELFDRPRSGFVRAIQRKVDALTSEQWRDCLMGALLPQIRVDREHAVRQGFARAQATYGADVQRLRAGGRADHALRSAINSCVRHGYLERDGAAYLTRVAAEGAPTLRGIATEPRAPEVTEETPPEHATPEDLVTVTAPIAEEPTPVAAEEPAHAPERTSGEPEAAPRSPLDVNLYDLDLPTRAVNWAIRQELDTVAQLVAWPPEQFEKERNIGRRTIRETRERIEAHLGRSWEEAHAALRQGDTSTIRAESSDDAVDSATEALTAGGTTGWARLSRALTPEQRQIALLDLDLPTRMKNFVRADGITHVGQLFDLGYEALAQRDNLGRKSLNDTLDALRQHLAELASPPRYASFIEAWQVQLAALETVPRMIMTRRSGMHGARETLEELGAMLGVTRERVRQIEARVVERLSERSRFRRSLESELNSVLGAARAVPLELLAQEPWWKDIHHHSELLEYVTNRIFENELFLVTGPSGKRYLTRFGQQALDTALENVQTRLAKLEYPLERAAIDQILHSECDPLDPLLFSEFEQAVADLLRTDPARPDEVLGYGRRRSDEVIAFLNGQDHPVPIGLVEEHCGRGAFPDEVLYFKRGVVGLKRHFPDFDGWMARLVPPSLEVMQERPPGRQWLVPEIHEVLLERGLLPDWLGHWHLASLLRLSGQVNYLGRLRVATQGIEQERLQYEDLLEQLLEEAGEPLGFEELLARARVKSDVPEQSATLLVGQAPFVRLDERRVGLVERDIPGGPEAVARAIEAVVRRLNDTQEGLTPYQATELVHGLSEVHAGWPRELVTSVLRNESGIRIDRTKNIGLDEWDDARCPARPEFIRREVQRAGGSLALAELNTRLEAFYGRAPDRGSLGVIARELGLVIEAEVIRRPPSLTPAPLIERTAVTLPGIPTELREMFEELAREPLTDPNTLRQEIDKHVQDLEREHRVNEFVEVETAHELARQCHNLLDRWETLDTTDRHLAHAVIRYFVSWQDLEHDLDIGGLDDDKQLMNAVLARIAPAEVSNVSRAS